MAQQQIDYRVTVHEEDGGFWAEIADLPGCFASGDTMDELWEALAEAIGLYLSTDDAEVTISVSSHEPVSQQHDAKVLVCS